MEQNSKDILIKQLLYRSLHRGCKETDFLLGKFAEDKITSLNDNELLVYKDLIEEYDGTIYDWIVGRSIADKKYQGLIDKIKKYWGKSYNI